MRKAEQIVSIMWIGLGLLASIASIRLGVGNFSDPGPGFLPLGTGFTISVLAAIHLFLESRRSPQQEEETESLWENVHWKKMGYVLAALLIYALLLEKLGYLVDTFLLMVFLFSILERKKWWVVLLGSFLVIGITYLVFDRWLMVQFPKGIY